MTIAICIVPELLTPSSGCSTLSSWVHQILSCLWIMEAPSKCDAFEVPLSKYYYLANFNVTHPQFKVLGYYLYRLPEDILKIWRWNNYWNLNSVWIIDAFPRKAVYEHIRQLTKAVAVQGDRTTHDMDSTDITSALLCQIQINGFRLFFIELQYWTKFELYIPIHHDHVNTKSLKLKHTCSRINNANNNKKA